MGSLVLVIVLSLHMGRIIGPSHLLSLRGFHLPSGASDVIWSGSIKWSGTNQISPCRCTWRPLVKMCWRRRSEADGGASGERKPLCHSASLTFFKVLSVKNKAVLEINIKDVCLLTQDWHARWSLCSFVSTHCHAKHHWLPHSLGRLIIASWICLDIYVRYPDNFY